MMYSLLPSDKNQRSLQGPGLCSCSFSWGKEVWGEAKPPAVSDEFCKPLWAHPVGRIHGLSLLADFNQGHGLLMWRAFGVPVAPFVERIPGLVCPPCATVSPSIAVEVGAALPGLCKAGPQPVLHEESKESQNGLGSKGP